MSRNTKAAAEEMSDIFFRVADFIKDGLWSVDSQGCITYLNEAIAKILKAPAEEIMGRPIFDFIFEEDREHAKRILAQQRDGKHGFDHLDFRFRAADGSAVWAHCRPSPILDSNGQFAGAIAIVEDIASTEEAVEARELAAAIIDSSDDAIITKSLEGTIKSWNRGAERIFGYTAAEAIGESILMLLPRDRETEEAEILVLLREGKRVDHYITIRKRKDGALIDMSVTVSPLRNASGKIVGATKIAREITDQKRKADARSHLASIVESTDDAIVSKTTTGIIETWNRGAEKVFGYTAEEAIGKPILMIVPSDRKYEEADILSRICRGERVDHFETVRVRKDGTFVDVSVTISPILNEVGDVIGASKIARDISAEKRAKENMQIELDKLVKERTVQFEKANKEMEGFTYSVSHDLRGPLRSIVSSCMILREDFGPQLPAEAQDELAKQAKAAKRMADLIDDLLKLSRLTRQEIRKTNLNLTEIAEEISTELKHGGSACNIKIQKGMETYGDPPTIKLLLTNLMENACKFSGQEGSVEIGRSDGYFFVRDHGIGFDQQYEEKMFLPFERLVLDRDYPGTGIGLANVRRIADRHSGRVWAESEGTGKGATFYFSLPEPE
jgi:PAS domain S-box-containing protein